MSKCPFLFHFLRFKCSKYSNWKKKRPLVHEEFEFMKAKNILRMYSQNNLPQWNLIREEVKVELNKFIIPTFKSMPYQKTESIIDIKRLLFKSMPYQKT